MWPLAFALINTQALTRDRGPRYGWGRGSVPPALFRVHVPPPMDPPTVSERIELSVISVFVVGRDAVSAASVTGLFPLLSNLFVHPHHPSLCLCESSLRRSVECRRKPGGVQFRLCFTFLSPFLFFAPYVCCGGGSPVKKGVLVSGGIN